MNSLTTQVPNNWDSDGKNMVKGRMYACKRQSGSNLLFSKCTILQLLIYCESPHQFSNQRVPANVHVRTRTHAHARTHARIPVIKYSLIPSIKRGCEKCILTILNKFTLKKQNKCHLRYAFILRAEGILKKQDKKSSTVDKETSTHKNTF